MANYTSKHTGAQIDTGVDIYKVFSYVSASTSVTVGSSAVNFSAIAWTAEPKNNNTVYGIAFHPGTGALYWIKSINGAKTGVLFSSGSGRTLVL